MALQTIFKHLAQHLDAPKLQRLTNICQSITLSCKGDGAGLSSGGLIDMVVSESFANELPNYEECHEGEADMKILGTPLSLKSINGKSTIALDWSKNGEQSAKREHFATHIMILNKKRSHWWKKGPKKKAMNIDFDQEIPPGFYLIDKQWCKENIQLSTNNKTNTLISSQYLYAMLLWSIQHGLHVPLPDANKKLTFKILNAFQ